MYKLIENLIFDFLLRLTALEAEVTHIKGAPLDKIPEASPPEDNDD